MASKQLWYPSCPTSAVLTGEMGLGKAGPIRRQYSTLSLVRSSRRQGRRQSTKYMFIPLTYANDGRDRPHRYENVPMWKKMGNCHRRHLVWCQQGKGMRQERERVNDRNLASAGIYGRDPAISRFGGSVTKAERRQKVLKSLELYSVESSAVRTTQKPCPITSHQH